MLINNIKNLYEFMELKEYKLSDFVQMLSS